MGRYFLSDNKDFEILEEPYFDKLMALSQTENGVASFLKENAEKRLQLVLDEKLAGPRRSLKENEAALDRVDQSILGKQKDKEVAQTLTDSTRYLWDKCPKKSKPLLEKVFRDYEQKGTFNPADLEKVKNSFNAFEKITKKNEIGLFKSKLDYLVKSATENNLAEKLKADYKFRAFYDNQTSATSEKDASFLDGLETSLKDMHEERDALQQKQWSLGDSFEKLEQTIRMEDKQNCAVEAQCIDKAISDVKRKRTGESVADFHIERLSSMNDNDKVVFNLGVNKNGQAKLDAIFKEMGLSQGAAEDTNSWYQHDSTDGKNNLWSPVMKVSEAKKVMPKLVEYMHDANILSQLSVPMKAEEMFTEKKTPEPLKQEELNQFIQTLHNASLMKPMDQRSVFAEFPQEQYLFNGTQISDDYFGLSKRPGRSGILYATTNCNYAASYDGVNGTATHDDYGLRAIGQVNGEDVHIGFVNVYEQSKDDKFYDNFGMEDAFSKNPTRGLSLSREEALKTNCETFVTPEKNPLKDKILHVRVGAGREFYVKMSEVKHIPAVQKILDNRKSDATKSFDDLGMQQRFQKQKSEFLSGVYDRETIRETPSLDMSSVQMTREEPVKNVPEKEKSEPQVAKDSVQNLTTSHEQAQINHLRGLPEDYSPKNSQKEEVVAETTKPKESEHDKSSTKAKISQKMGKVLLMARGLIQPKKNKKPLAQGASKENVSQVSKVTPAMVINRSNEGHS